MSSRGQEPSASTHQPPAPPDSAGQRAEAAPARPPQDTSLASYAKWSALMIVVVTAFGFLASRVLRWLDLG